jgi:hypothetical protein
MEVLLVERIGGLARFGGSGSRLRSRGRIELAALTAAERDVIDALFASRSDPGPGERRDAFRYRITRATPRGKETIEVWEHLVPAALCTCVRDEIA